VITVTAPLRPDAREVGLAVINRVLPSIRAGLHDGDLDHLRHEAERWEAMHPSPLRSTVLADIDAERLWRRHLVRMGVGR
jgi:hypothetical protein